LIFPNGKIQEGRPERCEGAHARGYNSFIGISLVGDFSAKDNPSGSKGPSQPTRQQLKSLIRLTREMQRRYNIPVQRILRHSDVAPTLCPGERFAFKNFLLALERPSPGSR
jgi:N-acetylmuramoyl-L-alanine amidase